MLEAREATGRLARHKGNAKFSFCIWSSLNSITDASAIDAWPPRKPPLDPVKAARVRDAVGRASVRLQSGTRSPYDGL